MSFQAPKKQARKPQQQTKQSAALPRDLMHLLGTPLGDLAEMLQTKRPAYSKTEDAFIVRWLLPLGVRTDGKRNLILKIGESPVLWSCHTDTVHVWEGVQRIQRVGDLIQLHPKEHKANCLGGDCTTGVWLMREMIKAQVPGLYIFHSGEECGGIGSSHIAKHTPELLEGIKFAVAFDRKGKTSVITHQGGARGCSTEFAVSIAAQLPGHYLLDDGGLFTDTANYTGLVPECTNLSTGYEQAHTRYETQSISHALALREAMLKIWPDDWECVRDPEVDEEDNWWSYKSCYKPLTKRGGQLLPGWSYCESTETWNRFDRISDRRHAAPSSFFREQESVRERYSWRDADGDNWEREEEVDLCEAPSEPKAPVKLSRFDWGRFTELRTLADSAKGYAEMLGISESEWLEDWRQGEVEAFVTRNSHLSEEDFEASARLYALELDAKIRHVTELLKLRV